MNSTHVKRKDSFYSWYVVSVLAFTYMVAYIDRQILALLVDPIKADLHITDTQISLIQGFAFAIFYATLGLPLGRLADRKNRRNIIACGVLLWSIMTFLSGTAKDFMRLFITRMGVGVGEAALLPAAYSLIADYLSTHKQFLGMAILMCGGTLGVGLAYIFGGVIIQTVLVMGELSFPIVGEVSAWQMCFFIASFPGILAFLLLLTVKEPKRTRLKSEVSANASGNDSVKDVLHFLMCNRKLYGLCLGSFTLLAFVLYSLMSWLPAFYIRVHSLGYSDTGLLAGGTSILCGIPGGILAGWLSDKLRRQGMHHAPLLMTLLSALGLFISVLIMTLSDNLMYSAVALGVAMFFVTMPFSIAPAALQAITPSHMRGQITALYMFCINLIALGLGPMMVALLTDYYFVDEKSVGFSLAIVCCVALVLAAAMLMALMDRYKLKVISLVEA